MSTESIPHEVTHAKHLLVALDGGSESHLALEQAMLLAKAFGSDVTLIHVIDLQPGSMALAPDAEEAISAEAKQILDKGLAEVTAAGLKGEKVVHMGASADQYIVQEAKERNIDLIVLGTHGRTGLLHLLMGSVAEKVVGHAPCPVLVIPSKAG